MSMNTMRRGRCSKSIAVSLQYLWLLCVFMLGGTAAAQDVSRLTRFTEELSSFTADFEQTVYDADSNPLQTSTGSVTLKRPGRFIWDYLTPDPQTIVSNGDRVWLYDKGLEQVTVHALSDRAAGTPLELLMAEKPIGEAFTLKALGDAEGIAWFELTPKSTDTDFETVYLGLNEAGLAVMELRDGFGQATQIRFSAFTSDVTLNDEQFEFVVPEGVDVIGQ